MKKLIRDAKLMLAEMVLRKDPPGPIAAQIKYIGRLVEAHEKRREILVRMNLQLD